MRESTSRRSYGFSQGRAEGDRTDSPFCCHCSCRERREFLGRREGGAQTAALWTPSA